MELGDWILGMGGHFAMLKNDKWIQLATPIRPLVTELVWPWPCHGQSASIAVRSGSW